MPGESAKDLYEWYVERIMMLRRQRREMNQLLNQMANEKYQPRRNK